MENPIQTGLNNQEDLLTHELEGSGKWKVQCCFDLAPQYCQGPGFLPSPTFFFFNQHYPKSFFSGVIFF